jgi:hypothetical protein
LSTALPLLLTVEIDIDGTLASWNYGASGPNQCPIDEPCTIDARFDVVPPNLTIDIEPAREAFIRLTGVDGTFDFITDGSGRAVVAVPVGTYSVRVAIITAGGVVVETFDGQTVGTDTTLTLIVPTP